MKTKKISLIFIVFIIYIISALSLNAQYNYDRTKIDSNWFKFNRMWNNPNVIVFQTQFPKLNNVPPLRTDMPYDILLAYIYLDSLLKNASYDTINFKLREWYACNQKNDTLTGLIKYFYKLLDYDPVMFNQYCFETLIDTIYKYKPQELRENIQSILKKLLKNNPKKNAIFPIFFTDCILKVRVNQIIGEGISKLSPDSTKLVNINATVLDTIKGRTFKQCYIPYAEFKGMVQENNNQICFQYLPKLYYSYFETGFKFDSLLKADDGFKLTPGMEYIIFFGHGHVAIDLYNDYIDVTLRYPYALPIINGMVHDPGHLWSNNNEIEYSLWKSNFMEYREIILDGGY